MKKTLYIAILIIVVVSCKKPYNLPAVASTANYLVVEGLINTGTDSTIITLSRTVSLGAKNTLKVEPGASLAIEGNAAAAYPLTEIAPGKYASPPLNLSAANTYRLSITTADGHVYQSDFVNAVPSPPIDSVSYKVLGNSVQVNISSHDPKNNTHYYRYDYDETWTIRAAYDSKYETEKIFSINRIILRKQQIYECWQNYKSSTIVLGSSAKLTQDVVTDVPVINIPSSSEKIANKYSILVRQYGLTAKSYSYWQQLKKNTESLGSIFDGQPSEIPGNIHRVDKPTEPVIGYISAGTVEKKRIYINNFDLPRWTQIVRANDGCKLDTLYYKNPKTGVDDVAAFLYYKLLYPVDAIGFPVIVGYLSAPVQCVDCTLRGTNVKPDFWP